MTIDELDDAVAAAAFRRLVHHLRHRSDAHNVDLMGLAGFCRNCLGEWLAEASEGTPSEMDWVTGRELIYGMPYGEWKARHQIEASPEQIERMKASIARNRTEAALDAALDASFPASDPPAMIEPNR